MNQLVNLFRLAGRKSNRTRKNRGLTQRRLGSETLEKRQLLASDVLVAHNYLIAEDVNRDYKVTPLDALSVINQIARHGGTQNLAGMSRGDLDKFYDVSGDNKVSPLDALRVINNVSRAEGLGDNKEVVELRLTPLTTGDVEFTDGNKFNPASRDLNVTVGEVFNLEVGYKDLRDAPTGDLGIFQFVADIVAASAGKVEPVLTETQTLAISANVFDGVSGDVVFTRTGITETPFKVPVATFIADGDVATIKSAISDLYNLTPQQFTVVSAGPGINNDVEYDIRFTDFSLANVDVADLKVSGNLLDFSGGAVTVTSTNNSIEPRLPSGAINPAAIAPNLNFKSRTYGANLVFFGINGVFYGSYDPAVGVTGAGGVGDLVGGGVPESGPKERLKEPFDAFSLPFVATAPTTTKVEVRASSATTSEFLIYTPVPAEARLVQPLDNLASSTTVFLDTVSGFRPLTGETSFLIKIDSEQMLVTAVNSTLKTLTVVRGQNNTTIASHSVPPVTTPPTNNVETFQNDTLTTAQIFVDLGVNPAIATDGFGFVNVVATTAGPVNDAPAGTNNTKTIAQGATYTFAAADFGFTDPLDTPANNFADVRITTIPAAADGTLRLSGTAVTAGQVIAVASIPNLTFVPVATVSGNGRGAFTFQVRDNGGTANGGVDLDPTANTFNFNITTTVIANDAPAGTDNTKAIAQGATYTFAVADFGFTDPLDTPANSFADVRITTIPAAADGVLRLNGTAVTAGQVILVASIPNLTFVPVATVSGNGRGAFTFQVRDNGGTANGGVDLDQSPNTFNFNITATGAKNDAPAGTNTTKVIAQGATYTFAVADFGFTDPLDTPANNFVDVRITTIPAAADGTLRLSGTAVTAGQVITVASIPNLTFVPVATVSGNGRGAFTFQVRDNGGTANGGVDLDQSPNTFNFNITATGAKNDAPAGTNNTKVIAQGATYTFAVADFGFTDPLDTPANSFVDVRITTIPAAADGTLRLSGTAVTAGQVITVASIPNLTFVPVATVSGNGRGAFTFQVRDNGGTANGGIDLDQSPNTFNFNITPTVVVNTAPSGTNNTKAIAQGSSFTFAVADFGFTDPLNTPANTFVDVRITTVPATADGSLELNGTSVTAGQVIPVGFIPNLTFVPVASVTGNSRGAFTFQVRDNGGTANGGVDLDQSPNTFNFNITATVFVNAAPAGANITKAILEGASYTFAVADFGFSDPNNTPANSFVDVRIATLPAAADGSLRLNGVAVSAGQAISVAAIPTLTFVPGTNLSGANRGAFTFQVRDNGGTANGGVDLDQSPNTFNFTITNVNDAPAGASATRTVANGAAYTFSAADFPITDTLDSPANTLAGIVINTLPNAAQGSLRLAGVAVNVSQFVTLAQLPTLTFNSVAGVLGDKLGSFTFQARDNGGTANGGVDTDPTSNTFDFNLINFVPSTISGTIFTDFLESLSNPIRDGLRDSNEPAIGGLSVRLSRSGTADVVRLTDADGNYAFSNLAPGTYTVKFDIPSSIIPGSRIAGATPTTTLSSSSFQVVIATPGGLNASGNNFTVLGTQGTSADTLDILVSHNRKFTGSTSRIASPSFAVLSAEGDQQFFQLGDGFEDVRFAELTLNDDRDAALLTVLNEDGSVESSILSGNNLAVGSDGKVVGLFGDTDGLKPVSDSSAALAAEFGDYRDAIDAIIGSGTV